MSQWAFYPVIGGTIISICSLSYLAWKEHVVENPRTLSQLAADKHHILRYFRLTLLTCGPLFAVTTYGFILPVFKYRLALVVTSALMFVPELLVAIFPARGKTKTLHDSLGTIMGFGMFSLAITFAAGLRSGYRYIEIVLICLMAAVAIGTLIDKKRYLLYELPFIYLSHISIVIAALAIKFA
jgi:hypothetical protein